MRRRAAQLSEATRFLVRVAAFHPEKVPAEFRREYAWEITQERLAKQRGLPMRIAFGPAVPFEERRNLTPMFLPVTRPRERRERRQQRHVARATSSNDPGDDDDPDSDADQIGAPQGMGARENFSMPTDIFKNAERRRRQQ